MSENPLGGLRVPSVAELSERAVAMLGQGVIDLRNPLQRQRLRNALGTVLGAVLDEIEAALVGSQEKAVKHVFRLMANPDYQAKRTKRLKERREQRLEREQQREAERVATARAKMAAVKPEKVVIQ